MGTSVRIDPGARLYRDVMIGSDGNIFIGTTVARISADAHATMAIVDLVQGPNSIVGRTGPSGPADAVYGTWNHSYDSCTAAPDVDHIEPYHSFFWFGLVDGFLRVELFDGRPTMGPMFWGSGTNLVLTSPARIPTAPVCCHVACVAQWPTDSGAIGTYTLYVDGVAVISGTTNPSTGHGTYQFFYDFSSLSIGVDKVGYRPQVGSVRLMQLRGSSDIFTPEYLLWEATHPCAVLFGGNKFNYPFDTASGIKHEPSLPGYDLTLETGATSIDLTVPDCCGGTAPPWIAPSYDLDVRYIRRLRRAPHVTQENTRVFVRRFELDLERGQGLATGQGSDPMVMLRISRDGGQTWGEEIRLAAGALGAYTERALARRLGHGRDLVFEVTVSDPIAWSLVGAWLDAEPGSS